MLTNVAQSGNKYLIVFVTMLTLINNTELGCSFCFSKDEMKDIGADQKAFTLFSGARLTTRKWNICPAKTMSQYHFVIVCINNEIEATFWVPLLFGKTFSIYITSNTG